MAEEENKQGSQTYQARIAAQEFMVRYQDSSRILGFCKQCPRFGKNWSCPPLAEALLEKLRHYHWVRLIAIQTRVPEALQAQHFSPEELYKASYSVIDQLRDTYDPRMLALEKRTPGSLVCLAGSCRGCEPESCARGTGHPCRHPELLRPSLEAYGFDVARASAELLHLPLEWPKAGQLPGRLAVVYGVWEK